MKKRLIATNVNYFTQPTKHPKYKYFCSLPTNELEEIFQDMSKEYHEIAQKENTPHEQKIKEEINLVEAILDERYYDEMNLEEE